MARKRRKGSKRKTRRHIGPKAKIANVIKTLHAVKKQV